MIFTLFAFALLLGLAISGYAFWQQKKQGSLLFISLLFGAVLTLPVLFLEQWGIQLDILNSSNFSMGLMFSIFVIGITAEILKFLFLYYFVLVPKNHNSKLNSILASVVISMGFAVTMLCFAFFQGKPLILLTVIPAQLAIAILMGHFIGMAKAEQDFSQQFRLLNTGLAASIVIHGLYIFFSFQNNLQGLVLLSVGTLAIAIQLSFGVLKSQLRISPQQKRNLEEEEY